MGKHKRKKKQDTAKVQATPCYKHISLKKIAKSDFFEGEKVTVVRGLEEKMSEVILDFAEPILNYEYGMKNGKPWLNVASTLE